MFVGGSSLLLVVLLSLIALPDHSAEPQIHHHHNGSFVHTVLKKRFHDDFLQTCGTHFSELIEWHKNKLLYPGDKYIVFVMHENGFKNGGFGDRLGGLVNAITIAMRFNRTLLIKSENDFGTLFKPYHPDDHSHEKYNYTTWTAWTNYNHVWDNRDETEYDLWMCINHGGNKNSQCSMEWGDVSQPTIKLKSNRAFLATYSKQTNSNTYHDLQRFGLNESTNLFLMGGCMLRLAMWPTEMLWDYLHEAIENHELDLKRQGIESTLTHDGLLKWQYLISMHFRCGDYGYLGRLSDDACIHTPDKEKRPVDNIDSSGSVYDVLNLPVHGEAGMERGNPLDMGRCAKSIMRNITAANSSHHPHHHARTRFLRVLHEHEHEHEHEHHVVVHIASDQHGASHQMNATVHYPATIVSPNGCHIEMDSSFQCLRLTVVYWFLMALSDSLIAQCEGGLGSDAVSVASGFARYAYLYSIKPEGLVDARNCKRLDTWVTSRHSSANWW